jgi:prevent-host-death family protein
MTECHVESIGIYEAKSKLSELVEKAEAGQEVIITRRGRPVAKLVRAKRQKEEVDSERSALIDEIITFSKTCEIGRIDLRKLIAKGRE